MSQPISNEVFELSTVTDNPIFEGFAFETDPSLSPSLLGRECLEDDICPGYGTSDTVRQWQAAKLALKWKAPRLTGRVVPFNDYPCIDVCNPAFSERACDALRELLKPNGELLPVRTESGSYFFYNVTTVVDVLDVKKSKCNFWCDPPTTAVSIDYFEFYSSKLKGLSIFRIIDWPTPVFVSRGFVDRVYEAGLNGFEFRKVWPLARNVNWRVHGHDKPAKKDARKLSQHTLVLICSLAGKKPSRVESMKIKRIEEELDSQLVLKYHNARYFGSYEGSDTVEKECRLFISCPDVDALIDKLKPWLAQLDWPNPVYLMKRYGDMHDKNAKEEVLELNK